MLAIQCSCKPSNMLKLYFRFSFSVSCRRACVLVRFKHLKHLVRVKRRLKIPASVATDMGRKHQQDLFKKKKKKNSDWRCLDFSLKIYVFCHHKHGWKLS